ncbi:aspartate/glutamate racemase family protein [Sphingosinicella soli]|uniref:Allantoin racemase n=1 Tax=Sphingosinicella soli TaxID=333708 RepID=A0A7W7F7X9_9SPHN|nr:aspartate/glutamate racemase family protein [Sphingosinicella soli]MBB4633154.1 allantoin racemase [Sphingosinicella soli]
MRTPRIHILTPITGADAYDPSQFAEMVGSSAQVSCSAIARGPASIENAADEVMAGPEILRSCLALAADGVDAIVIDCFGDPGVAAARELLSIPVVGPGQSSLHRAATLADRFGVVTILDSVLPLIRDMGLRAGLSGRLCSVRALGIPVLALEGEHFMQALREQALAAVRDDGAEALILGCTGMFGVSERLSAYLSGETGNYIPVVDPISSAVLDAVTLARLGLSHSKRTSIDPPARTRESILAIR